MNDSDDKDVPETKPRTDEDVRAMDERRLLMEELFGERTIVASGKRAVNRTQDYKKERCIEEFIAANKIASYPVIAQDLEAEQSCEWLDDSNIPKRRTLREALVDEIAKAHAVCNAEPPRLASSIAVKLLSSDLEGKTRMLCDLAAHEITVEVVLAHLEALGYELPKRIALGVARRATMLLMNRHRFQSGGC